MRVFITGSTTGLGLLAGQQLLQQGHEVVLHARNRSSTMTERVPYVIGDLSIPSELRSVADQANRFGTFDAVIQNAGLYTARSEDLFAVNVVAPYVLSTLLHRPERMIYLSSGMHMNGKMNLNPKSCNYSDTKLFVLMLAKWFAREWPKSFVNAVDPGWVPTRMGGAGAPDDLKKGAETQVWLATRHEPETLVTGKYFHHQKERESNPIADSIEEQQRLITLLSSSSPE